ncbi:MAG: TIGR03621 family F420-dependent LLM class oxidoreductase [Streptosporangiaceae bacterium]
MPDMQFGVNFRAAASKADFERLVRRADELGFDVLALPDHLGAAAPFSTLAAAGAISSRLRLTSYVLNVGFWNPALLAREVATLDLLSGGRAELGIGAGHAKSEHEDAGLAWLPFRPRIELLERTAVEVRRRLADPGHEPAPVQRPVPLLVAAMSAAGLAVAARHADIVGFSGLRQLPGQEPGTFRLSTAAETAQAVATVREQAGGRAYRSDALLQRVVIGQDPGEAAAAMAAAAPPLSPAEILDSPFMLFGRTAEEAAGELERRGQEFGFDRVTTHQSSLEALGQVIAAYRAARSGPAGH